MNHSRYSDIQDFDFDSVSDNTDVSGRFFDDFDSNQFEKWLESGLKDYLIHVRGSQAFPGAENWIAKHQILEEGLKEFYGVLSGKQQGHFKSAVADLLASLPAIHENIPLFRSLLLLATLLPASEVLRVLPQRIGNGFFGQFRDNFDQALMTAASLSAPRNDAIDCLGKLISSRQFNTAFAGIALLALCKADDGNFVKHMEKMRIKIHGMFHKYARSKNAKRIWAEQVLEVIQLKPLAKALPTLKYFDPSGTGKPLDTWFLDGLFGGIRPLLICSKGGRGELQIARYGVEESCESLPLHRRKCGDFVSYLREKNYIFQPNVSYECDENGDASIRIGTRKPENQESRIEICPIDGGISPELAKHFGIAVAKNCWPTSTSQARSQQ